MDDDRRFCVKCGCMLPPEASFCPECGTNISGGSAHTHVTRTSARSLDSITTWMLFYGVIAILFGAYMVYCAFNAEELLTIAEDMFEEMYDEPFDLGVTADDLRTTYLFMAVMFMISGVCALISWNFVRTRANYKLASITCLIAAIAAIPLIFTTVFGLIIWLKIRDNQGAFDY